MACTLAPHRALTHVEDNYSSTALALVFYILFNILPAPRHTPVISYYFSLMRFCSDHRVMTCKTKLSASPFKIIEFELLPRRTVYG